MNEYESRVQRGREFLTGARRSLWGLADVAAEFDDARTSDDRRSQTLGTWAADIGISPSRAREYRAVAKAWPPEHRREDRSFQVHIELMNDPQRFEMIEDVAKLRDIRPVTSDAEVKERIVKNPAIVEEAAYEDEGVATHARMGSNKRFMERMEAQRETREQNFRENIEEMRERGEHDLADDLEASHDQLASSRHLRGEAQDEAVARDLRLEPWRMAQRALSCLGMMVRGIKREQDDGHLPGEGELLEALEKCEAMIAWARTAINQGGPTDWDAEFGKMLDSVGDET